MKNTRVHPAVVRTAKDRRALWQYKVLGKIHLKWEWSQKPWQRRIAAWASSKQRKIEEYLADRAEKAMNAQGIWVADCGPVERFYLATTSNANEPSGLAGSFDIDEYNLLLATAEDSPGTKPAGTT